MNIAATGRFRSPKSEVVAKLAVALDHAGQHTQARDLLITAILLLLPPASRRPVIGVESTSGLFPTRVSGLFRTGKNRGDGRPMIEKGSRQTISEKQTSGDPG